MKEKPILFSTPMVYAILDGRKTMTRRVVKPQPQKVLENTIWFDGNSGKWKPWVTPYGRIGDILWVRETWQETTWMSKDDENYGYIYKASENGKDWEENTENWKWKPSIFMPREACRIKLRITDIRIERLNRISEKDAKAEGVEPLENGYKQYIKTRLDKVTGYASYSFMTLWESINGNGSWEKNPYVWVIVFERVV